MWWQKSEFRGKCPGFLGPSGALSLRLGQAEREASLFLGSERGSGRPWPLADFLLGENWLPGALSGLDGRVGGHPDPHTTGHQARDLTGSAFSTVASSFIANRLSEGPACLRPRWAGWGAAQRLCWAQGPGLRPRGMQAHVAFRPVPSQNSRSVLFGDAGWWVAWVASREGAGPSSHWGARNCWTLPGFHQAGVRGWGKTLSVSWARGGACECFSFSWGCTDWGAPALQSACPGQALSCLGEQAG